MVLHTEFCGTGGSRPAPVDPMLTLLQPDRAIHTLLSARALPACPASAPHFPTPPSPGPAFPLSSPWFPCSPPEACRLDQKLLWRVAFLHPLSASIVRPAIMRAARMAVHTSPKAFTGFHGAAPGSGFHGIPFPPGPHCAWPTGQHRWRPVAAPPYRGISGPASEAGRRALPARARSGIGGSPSVDPEAGTHRACRPSSGEPAHQRQDGIADPQSLHQGGN